MSSNVFALQVSPSIPPPLRRLADLAKNFRFSWNPTLGQLFRKLDPALWRKVESNPSLFLQCVDQSILERAADDPTFLDEYRRIVAAFDDYLGRSPRSVEGLERDDLIAYFCAEYGWHESFPIYSGGLGVLAGDHCKTASDFACRSSRSGCCIGRAISSAHRPQRPTGARVPADRAAQHAARVGAEPRRQRAARACPRPTAPFRCASGKPPSGA